MKLYQMTALALTVVLMLGAMHRGDSRRDADDSDNSNNPSLVTVTRI